jgi:hypothetical protein
MDWPKQYLCFYWGLPLFTENSNSLGADSDTSLVWIKRTGSASFPINANLVKPLVVYSASIRCILYNTVGISPAEHRCYSPHSINNSGLTETKDLFRPFIYSSHSLYM